MKITYHVNKDSKRLYCEIKGKLDVKSMIEAIKEILEHPDFGKGYLTLIDISKSIPSTEDSYEQIKRFGLFIDSNRDKVGKLKCAIYASNITQYCFSELLITAMEPYSIDMKTFFERDKASQYLAGRSDFLEAYQGL